MYATVPNLTDLTDQLRRIAGLTAECRALARDAVPDLAPHRLEDVGARLDTVEETLDGLFD